jgi:hypothetical protein
MASSSIDPEVGVLEVAPMVISVWVMSIYWVNFHFVESDVLRFYRYDD